MLVTCLAPPRRAEGGERIATKPELVRVPTGPDADAAALAEAADRDAVERTIGGDTEAFALVVRRHGPGLVSLCARMVRDRALGEELAQEALARAYSNLAAWRGDCRFRHWLFRIAMNCCRDYLKAGARAERPSDLKGDELVAARDPERDVSGRQIVAALEVAVGKLPPKYREAFILFHVENVPYEEIEAITGINTNALKVRVHRARQMLREALGDLLE